MSSTRIKLALSFVVANVLLATIIWAVWLSKPNAPPQIQGVLLTQGKDLSEFSLLDHNNQQFGNRNLLGQWHLVSYGFTHCPDVCPTTLSILAAVSDQLISEGREPLNILFYSVDHRRDTAAHLASYLPFFDSKFLGLTHTDNAKNLHLPFEQGLGIFAKLTSAGDTVDGQYTSNYEVSHGVTLFLLNPQGQLQAIFEPGEDQYGSKVFDSQTIFADYLKIRRYFDQPTLANISPGFGSSP
ncbi:MAG: SCO family protein [Halioglobus sp.]